ncbi:MAG: cbb3-type cytochrome oxidase assembly protein CcoS [Gammaproteobacteria bacterium]
MEILYLLVPLAAVLAMVIAAGFLWAIATGQFDDLEGPAHQILMDDDRVDPDQDGS